jgi:hypothetical protein
MGDLTVLKETIASLTAAVEHMRDRQLAKDALLAEQMIKLADANSMTLSMQLGLEDATAQLKDLEAKINSQVADVPPAE